MVLDHAQLRALLAVSRARSFEGASRELGITPSAVSQRIRALEEHVGAVLLRRNGRIVPTEAGVILCEHAEIIEQSESKAIREFPTALARGGMNAPKLRVIVNDDSLSSWFMDVLAEDAETDDPRLFDISIADQDVSLSAMKAGHALTAISSTPDPIHGYRSRFLGLHVYRATASPRFVERWFPDGVTLEALERVPSLRYSADDELQQQWIVRVFDREQPVPTHILPSSACFTEACRRHVGWGVHPAHLVDPHIESGELVELIPGEVLEKPLYWHVGLMAETAVLSLTKRVVRVARRHLVQPPRKDDDVIYQQPSA